MFLLVFVFTYNLKTDVFDLDFFRFVGFFVFFHGFTVLFVDGKFTKKSGYLVTYSLKRWLKK